MNLFFWWSRRLSAVECDALRPSRTKLLFQHEHAENHHSRTCPNADRIFVCQQPRQLFTCHYYHSLLGNLCRWVDVNNMSMRIPCWQHRRGERRWPRRIGAWLSTTLLLIKTKRSSNLISNQSLLFTPTSKNHEVFVNLCLVSTKYLFSSLFFRFAALLITHYHALLYDT